MRLKYNQPRGSRIRKQIDSITVDGDFWWQESTNTWVSAHGKDWDENSIHCSHHDVSHGNFPKSEKAFIRYMKRHANLAGAEVTVMTRWVGHHFCVPGELC